MISSERIALVMLGVTIVAAVCVIGVTRCSDSDIVPLHQPLVVDTVAVPERADTVAVTVPPDSAAGSRRPARRRIKRKRRDVAPPAPARDYLDERI